MLEGERRYKDVFMLEEIGRLLASARERPIGEPLPQYPEYSDREFFSDAHEVVSQMEKRIEEYASSLAGEKEREVLEKLKHFSSLLADAALLLVRASFDHAGKPRYSVVLGKDIEDALRKVDAASEDIWGKRCTWLLGHVEQYTFSAALNDFTACYHRLLEKVTELVGFTDVEKRITVHPGAGSFERGVCEAWSEGYKLMREHYSREDDMATWCYAAKGRVWIRLGSTPGHALHINLDAGTLDYYDANRSVNETMAMLWGKYAGIKCTAAGGTTCTGVKGEKARRAAIIAAAATSMDFRLANPLQFWKKEGVEGFASIIIEKLRKHRLL